MNNVPMGTGMLNHPKDITKKTKNEFNSLLKKFEEGIDDKDIYKFIKNKSLHIWELLEAAIIF